MRITMTQQDLVLLCKVEDGKYDFKYATKSFYYKNILPYGWFLVYEFN